MTRFSQFCVAAVLILGTATAPDANAAVTVVLDFNELEMAGVSPQPVGLIYENHGFRLENTLVAAPFGPLEFYPTGDGNYITDSGAALYADDPGSLITLTRIDGGVFDLVSIDIGRLLKATANPISLSFNGVQSGGGAPSKALSLSVDADEFSTVGFTDPMGDDFTSLTSVSWTQAFSYHQFDNITMQVTAVPEPASLAFLAVGLGVGIVRRARRKQIVNTFPYK
ncbi:hypothetical protein RBSH_05925 [Rhodopirellula baltica SH28]|uniref:Ice-binding protein C-terminal domain-containing protein n=1 Tax=Rhodopirellula baltica SH28 TaxID=993517 RepID=K5D8T2_RHOBT|nr:PEP-CTERM sorting domain-containing protein [Rhodopirellula baltica]EKJ98867.1 hypothetical protein RBSH_05925 [Rhodopirellula baltica SH28]